MLQPSYYIDLINPRGEQGFQVHASGYPKQNPEVVYNMLLDHGPRFIFNNNVLAEESWNELKPKVEIDSESLVGSIEKLKKSVSINNVWARIDQSIILAGTIVAFLLCSAQDVFNTQQTAELAIGSTVATTLSLMALEVIRYNTSRKKVMHGVATDNDNIVIKPYPDAVY